MRNQFNEFEIFILFYNYELEFRIMKRILKLFYEIVSIKPCINRENDNRISKLSYIVVVVT